MYQRVSFTEFMRSIKALDYLQKRLSDSTNNDQKTSVYHCMITWLDKSVLELENVIDILSLHSDDPNVWSKLIKLIDVKSDQYVGFVLTIVRLCRKRSKF